MSQATAPGAQSAYRLPCVLYTQGGRCSGRLLTNHRRLSDALNAWEEAFVELAEARVETFPLEEAEGEALAAAHVHRDSVLFAVAVEAGAPSPSRAAFLVDKQTCPAAVRAGPFDIAGQFHLVSGESLGGHLRSGHTRFSPVTQASVVCRTDSSLCFSVPVLLLQKRAVDLAFSAVAEPAAGTPPAPPPAPPTLETARPAVSAPQPREPEEAVVARAALAWLGASALFRGADIRMLQPLADDLCREHLLGTRTFPSKAVVYRQEEREDVVYGVLDGRLEMHVLGPGGSRRLVATLGMGDIFGESAFLGESRRQETVTALEEVRLLAMNPAAFRALLPAHPPATGLLLRLMSERSAARTG